MALDDKRKSASSEFEGMSGDKQKALTAALAQIEKQFGKGSIMRLGDAEIGRYFQENYRVIWLGFCSYKLFWHNQKTWHYVYTGLWIH